MVTWAGQAGRQCWTWASTLLQPVTWMLPTLHLRGSEGPSPLSPVDHMEVAVLGLDLGFGVPRGDVCFQPVVTIPWVHWRRQAFQKDPHLLGQRCLETGRTFHIISAPCRMCVRGRK